MGVGIVALGVDTEVLAAERGRKAESELAFAVTGDVNDMIGGLGIDYREGGQQSDKDKGLFHAFRGIIMLVHPY